MGSTDSAHEIDDRHDHHAWRDDLHPEGDRSATLGADDIGAGRDNDEKELTRILTLAKKNRDALGS